MWKKILLIQLCVCMFIVSGYLSVCKSESEQIQKNRLKMVAAMSSHYTVSDIWDKGKKAAVSLINTPTAVTSYIINVQKTQQYAEPIDPVAEGEVTSIYAVAGGQIMETGECKKLGKYIKIKHDSAVSVYGNCCRIYAEEGKHVRKGQVIGSYKNEKNSEFYYDLIEE